MGDDGKTFLYNFPYMEKLSDYVCEAFKLCIVSMPRKIRNVCHFGFVWFGVFLHETFSRSESFHSPIKSIALWPDKSYRFLELMHIISLTRIESREKT